MTRIFLVEDDIALRQSLTSFLRSWNYEVVCGTHFEDLISEFEQNPCDLILLDLLLPSTNGLQCCRSFREITDVPIVFLSSADQKENIILAMNFGADDFISKPVDPLVLAAKIDAILRRYRPSQKSDSLSYEVITLDTNRHVLQVGEKEAELSRNEHLLLAYFLRHAEQVISRESLMTCLWENGDYVADNTLTVNISRLRKLLSDMGADNYLHTKVGEGYILHTPKAGTL